MDSGNSGNLQSSSGGGDEFDSRCGGDSSPLSALLRQPPPPPSVAAFAGSFYGLQELAMPPPLSHWSTTPLPATGAGASPSPQSSSCHGVAASADQATGAAAAQPAVAAPPRGSRKRTRASRRAPTTVLTTDTSNFRAMVQEFTGIPSPPFASASARSRFDLLFPSRSAATGGSPATLSPYLLRPFTQKLHASPYPPFTSPSTSAPAPATIAIAAASTAASATPNTAAVASSDCYQLASAPSTLLGMQDHGSNNYLSFQSSLAAQLDGDAKYPAHPLFDRGLAPAAARLQDPAADFLGLTHGIMSSEVTQLHPRNGDHADELSGLVGGATVTGTGGCKATYSSGARSDAHAAPLLERNAQSTSTIAGSGTTTTPVATAAMRTQGADSWICTSE
uniref:VQ domain-containing protein n=1 Tax=Arundo donax TaxID=35708 RepID=A0A0A9B7R7_ARUDO